MTTDTKPPKQLAASTIAGRAYEKIRKLETLCEAEIIDAPDQIRAKYADKIAQVEASIENEEAREMLAKLRAP